jgi:hypothetical protein
MAGPRWVRLDVEYFGNPKIARLTAHAKLLHLASICWCGAHLTDGHIAAEIIPQLLQSTQARRVHVVELVANRVWYEVDGDYLIHDYTSMQDSREKVERKRRQAAERIAKWRADHDM